jgi:UDP-N-acetylmuramoyl-tripeptide--D-alanyl-D-alanine ligase
MSLLEIALATHGTIARRGRGGTEPAAGVFSDSRAVVPGSVFVALRGAAHDGHAFVPAAVRAGARIVVIERHQDLEIPDEASVVEVDDTLVAWGGLARAHLTKWRMEAVDGRVVAITGSAGKTTTKELTAALLAEVAPTHFTAGNLNNRIGVPAVVFGLQPSHQFCVLEMGMSLPGELDAITAFAQPDVAVVVNVGVAHAEGVGGREGVMREKGAVYRALGPRGVAVVNVDDEYVVRAAQGTRARKILGFGRGTSGASPLYRLVDRRPERSGSRVQLSCAGREVLVHLPIPGEAAAIDLAAAIAAQEAASGEVLSAEAIEHALSKVALQGRGTVRRLEDDIVVLDDTYNANPASMRAALATLAEIAGGRRRVVVLGEMKELGALAREEHEALGEVVADAGVALAIGCGGLVDLTLDRAAARGVEVVRASTTAEAASEVAVRVRRGDVVLVKGSRSVGAEKVVAALLSSHPEIAGSFA